MSFSGEVPAAITAWFLDKLVSPFLEQAGWLVRRRWRNFDWQQAEQEYRRKLIKEHGMIRIFGKSDPVPLDGVFTDVNILDEVNARRRYSVEHLHDEMANRFERHRAQTQRVSSLALVKRQQNLFILGKPGAGKTTLLRFIALQTARHNLLNRVPVFVELRTWVQSGYDEFLPYIVNQFVECNFPDAASFVSYILERGKAVVLFDGLDEVRQEGAQRQSAATLLQAFAKRFDRTQCLITCRIAASKYAFQGFRDVEVADFTQEQIKTYVRKWFASHEQGEQKAAEFLSELDKAENAGLRELCSAPLLLSMLCVTYDANLTFPSRRSEVYKDALEAMLRKWDTTRNIQRDAIYRGLSYDRKLTLLSQIAYAGFSKGNYIFPKDWLEQQIKEYLSRLPGNPLPEEIDGEAVLDAIEAQHSVLVERATQLYSFSHLTLQEYLVAHYMIGNEARGIIHHLLETGIMESRWREVFLLIAEMLESADIFVAAIDQRIHAFIRGDATLSALLSWAEQRATTANPPVERQSAVRLAYIELALARESVRTCARTLACAHARALTRASDLVRDLVRDHDLARKHDLIREIAHKRDLVRDLARDHDLARDLSVQVGLDYGLYYAWVHASLFAIAVWPRADWQVQQSMAGYRGLLYGVSELAEQANQQQLLVRLEAPAATASPQGWQQCADRLYAIMQARDLVHAWKFTNQQIDQLNDYFYANELLVQCLNVAVVSDRQAILAGVLAPPKID